METEKLLAPIDFEKIDQVIAQEQERSIRWLKNSLSCSNENQSMSSFDITSKRIDLQEEVLEKTAQKIESCAVEIEQFETHLRQLTQTITGQFTTYMEEFKQCEQRIVQRYAETALYEDQLLFFIKKIREMTTQLCNHQIELRETLLAMQRQHAKELAEVNEQCLREIVRIQQQSHLELDAAKMQGSKELQDCLRIVEEDINNRIDQLEIAKPSNQI